MADGKLLTDDYVLNLLNEDARTAKFGSRLAKKRDRNAPKPNTRFLRNIIRDTDSHNAALLAKEQEESRAKGRKLGHDERRKGEDGERGVKRKREGDRPDRWASALGGLGRRTDERPSRKREERHERRKHDQSDGDEKSREPKRRDERSHRRRRSKSGDYDYREKPPERERHRKRYRDEKNELRSRSPPREHRKQRRRETSEPVVDLPDATVRRSTTADDSDPLEDLLGPAPPPDVQPRGRGAGSNKASNIDLRFNDPSYDPRADVDIETADEDEGDDWDTALEALRDRAKWRSQGAERLRAAGFAETDVERWQGSGREKDERDVKWKGRGETKEWDQGKVLNEDGDVKVKAAWTLFKNT